MELTDREGAVAEGIRVNCTGIGHHRFLPLRLSLVRLPHHEKVFLRQSAFVMGGEIQRHLVEPNVDIGMVLGLLARLRRISF